MPDIIIPVILLIDGLVCIVLAVFAHEIGLDPTMTWGLVRFALLFLGIILICIFLSSTFLINRKDGFSGFFKSETTKTLFSLVHLWGIIFLVYAWFITFGNFTTWDHTTHYYTQLADAFGKGHLYVDLKPGKALAEAPDPYHPTDRPPFSDEVWDMSLYKGKLFLYWGPVPALLIMPIQLIFIKKITDNYLVFFFFAGLLIVNSLIIIKLRRVFFPDIPAWIMLISIALIGLILPISWSLSTPNVYEAAIGAGQFFLLGGIYFILASIEQDGFLNKKNLFFAGIFWTCAVGSRAINVFSVIFLAALTSFWITKKLARPIRWAKYIQAIFALYIPLILGAILIGWYNWARFDSPFEFGLRYQITIFNLNKDMDLVFRPEYFLLNIYIYIFQPFPLIPKFPFILPIIASTMMKEHGLVAPYLYAAGRVTGLLFSAPFLAFSLAHLFPRNIKSRIRQIFNNPEPYDFAVSLLAGSFLINFLCISFYFFGQMRFLVDVVSQITLLAITGYWQLLFREKDAIFIRPKLILFLANSLILFTICASLLLALTSESNRMQTLNPALFDKVNSVLSIPK
jgi:hypothetical protein